MDDTKKEQSIAPTLAKTVKYIHNEAEYLTFIKWCATPMAYREHKTQRSLAVVLGIHETTFSDWKLRPGFWDAVKVELKDWMLEHKNEVIGGLYASILRSGKRPEVELYLELLGDIEKKIEKPTVAVQVNIVNYAGTKPNGNNPTV